MDVKFLIKFESRNDAGLVRNIVWYKEHPEESKKQTNLFQEQVVQAVLGIKEIGHANLNQQVPTLLPRLQFLTIVLH